MSDFKDCVEAIEVIDINSFGLHFTWNQKPKKGIGVFKKIDCVMGNMKFGFKEAVEREWQQDVKAKKLLLKQGNLHVLVDNLRKELDLIQTTIDKDPLDSYLRDKEASVLTEFKEAQLDGESFLKQKAKVEWLELGDANSAFFHKTLKCKNHRSQIAIINDMQGATHEGEAAHKALVDHYMNFLGKEDESRLNPTPGLFDRVLNHEKAANMVRNITDEEIKHVMFSIGENKAPGPDGYHNNCEKQSIINLCFADDLLIFSHGDTRSVKVILDSINMFKDMLGLVSSMSKSTTFFCNVSDPVK
uniref:uncharacterized protein LOC122610332 n=1 Tax=Erigeron canadensis TaxID=72917 RepID=UPI001CB9A77B|nr:uncharacterized protein LOC122610332 [Erigeron canadensis]